jgi:hypothetical protein
MPFIETAPIGDAEVENINHYAGIRLRVRGVGNLIPTLYSLDKIDSTAMVEMTMAVTTAREPTRLCNFVSQRGILRLETDDLDDYMEIDRIIVFNKAIYTQFPGLD